jgi:hypothetical protein
MSNGAYTSTTYKDCRALHFPLHHSLVRVSAVERLENFLRARTELFEERRSLRRDQFRRALKSVSMQKYNSKDVQNRNRELMNAAVCDVTIFAEPCEV